MHTMKHLLVPVTLLLTLSAFSLPGHAGGTETFGEYQVHYNALTSDEIPPAVATGFGIVRSKNRALLTISVTRNRAADEPPGIQSTEADVTVEASNLTGQVKNARLRKVVEEGEYKATYYIAEINVVNGETLKFNINVQPEGSEDVFNVKFRQKFFTE